MRRFCGCDKGTRSVPATAKMWVEAGVGMSKANDLASRNPPERPKGAEAHTVLLGEVKTATLAAHHGRWAGF
jgi:hypothetical protein